MTKEIYEWEFPEPSHLVDLDRICTEVNDIPAVFARAYMRELRIRAPIVYGRLKEWAKGNHRLSWWNWDSKS